MSRKAIAAFSFLLLPLISGPASADEPGVTIIYPPAREVVAAERTVPAKVIKQTVAVTIVTVTRPVVSQPCGWERWGGDHSWTGWGLRGGSRTYSGPRYPF